MHKSFWRGGASAALLTAALGALSCLDRPLCSDCQPQTSSQFVLRVVTGGVDKIDLLFMIDNSISMSDKQALLSRAVPSLLSRFVHPLCVDEERKPNGLRVEDGRCASGVPEFSAVRDIHIAVVSSTLSLGTDTQNCTPDNDDKAWLLPKVRPGLALPSWNGSGFLAWDPLGTQNTPPGASDDQLLVANFKDMVMAVGESGCGYEASLEAWYRFLIEPDPPLSLSVQAPLQPSDPPAHTVPVGLDSELLAQRRAFLRPDSLVAVVMLSDENDCSLLRQGQGFLAMQRAPMVRASAACATDSNDPCCRPCHSTEVTPPPGCVALSDDPECRKGEVFDLEKEPDADPPNLRCWAQKRRFGVDFLEPTGKYVAGLTQPLVPDRNGVPQPNPLFVAAPGKAPRDPQLVYLAGIIGVPWQDIASDESLSGPGLRYLTAAELKAKNRWDVILGDPAHNVAALDPHMIESRAPRSGAHPFVAQAAIAPADAAVPPTADVISGHEQTSADDLQYACIFELETPVACSKGCDCDDPERNKRPLCQAPSGGSFGRTQYYGKAYPGLRQLEVLKGMGDQAIVASICPKVVRSSQPEADANFGYNPAMAALVDRFVDTLAGRCLARAPDLDSEGHPSCVVLEVSLSGSCNCGSTGRRAPPAEVLASVRDDLRKDSLCGGPNQPDCAQACACELQEAAAGTPLSDCRSTKDPGTQPPGYCYVDPEKGLGDPALVAACPSTGRRVLRFVGADTPRRGSITYMACLGNTLSH